MAHAGRLAFLLLLPLSVAANDFPTQARVEFVLGCMNERGGQSYDTLYPCVCLIDRIAETMSYAQFAEAQVFAQLRSTPGERGGMFRDPARAGELTTKLEDALEQGESGCFVGGPAPRAGSDQEPRSGDGREALSGDGRAPRADEGREAQADDGEEARAGGGRQARAGGAQGARSGAAPERPHSDAER